MHWRGYYLVLTNFFAKSISHMGIWKGDVDTCLHKTDGLIKRTTKLLFL